MIGLKMLETALISEIDKTQAEDWMQMLESGPKLLYWQRILSNVRPSSHFLNYMYQIGIGDRLHMSEAAFIF